MTRTDPVLWTSAPTTGFKIPVTARMIAMKFKVIEKVRLRRIVLIIFLDSRSRWGEFAVSRYECNIGCIYGNITADSSHRDSHTGLFQRRCIVDSVADHADRVPILF